MTGTWIVSPVGLNVQENLSALKRCISGVVTKEDGRFPLGQVGMENDAIKRRLALEKGPFSRTTLLAMLSLYEGADSARLPQAERTGLISGTSVGGLDRMEEHYMRSRLENDPEQLSALTYDNGRSTERLARFLGINGFVDTLSTACSSGANAIMYGGRLMEAGLLDQAIVGASDALTRFNLEGFRALKICDKRPCKPFDNHRAGLNLGEGAAYLRLENERSLAQTGHTPLCLLSGWHNASDAFHQTTSSSEGAGATLSMQGALVKAGLSPSDIGYINTHGTGTRNNDLSECMALKTVFGMEVPPFSSTKSFTGHALGSAGAIEAVFSVLALCEQAYLPNLNFREPMAETGWSPETSFRPARDLQHVLSNSFGFGGNCTSLIFSKAK